MLEDLLKLEGEIERASVEDLLKNKTLRCVLREILVEAQEVALGVAKSDLTTDAGRGIAVKMQGRMAGLERAVQIFFDLAEEKLNG